MYTLYMIKCNTPRHIYVGISCHYESRIESHRLGNGASFTKLHGVKDWKVISIHETEQLAKEAERHAVQMFRKLDFIVAGAGWTKSKEAARYSKRKLASQV